MGLSRARIHDTSLFGVGLSMAGIHDPSQCGVGLFRVTIHDPSFSGVGLSMTRIHDPILCGVALSRARKNLPYHNFNSIYYALFQSFIDYCLSVWGSPSEKHLNHLQKLQKRTARIIIQNFN